MRNIMLSIEYDGGRYSGWQRLGKSESNNSIENKIIEVIKKMTNEDIELFVGCRTETGVHAYAQIANFKTKSTLSIIEIKNYLNRYLPMDIAVTFVEEKPERFHSTLNAKSKTYLYRIAIGDSPCVFTRKYSYYSFKQPDLSLMKSAATLFLGKHDFRDFSSVKKNKSTIREITSIDIKKTDKEILITITASDFLHNMARIITSTILDIGLGQRQLSDIEDIFDLDNYDTIGSTPLSPDGLFLQKIEY